MGAFSALLMELALFWCLICCLQSIRSFKKYQESIVKRANKFEILHWQKWMSGCLMCLGSFVTLFSYTFYRTVRKHNNSQGWKNTAILLLVSWKAAAMDGMRGLTWTFLCMFVSKETKLDVMSCPRYWSAKLYVVYRLKVLTETNEMWFCVHKYKLQHAIHILHSKNWVKHFKTRDR